MPQALEKYNKVHSGNVTKLINMDSVIILIYLEIKLRWNGKFFTPSDKAVTCLGRIHKTDTKSYYTSQKHTVIRSY